MILFKRISYKNFLSTGNQPIEVALDMSQTTLVVGTKNYIIRRGIKPNLFEIFCDGKLINQDANNVDYQKYLESNIMKLNYRSFIQVVLLGSSSYEPFMKMKPRYRREVVEEILDIRVFGLMDLILRSQQSDLQKSLTEVRHQCELIKTKYETEAKQLKSLEDQGTDFQTHRQKLLDKNNTDSANYETKIQELNESIAVQKEKVKDKLSVDMKYSQLQKLEAKIETNLSSHKKTLEFFEQNDNCPVCTQSIDKSFKEQKCDQEHQTISKLSGGLQELVEELSKQEEKVTQFGRISNKIQDMTVEIAKIHTSLEQIKKNSDQIHLDISMAQNNDIASIKEDLTTMSTQLREAEEELNKVSEQKKYVDILREILNDKGAKAQIIKKYLPIMNQLINQHLQSMDFYVNFNLDEEFNETIKSRFRDTFNYNSFSEGEKMRIDLALLFTWRQIAKMKNSTNTNLLILDEIFDSSLDGQGMDDFFKIIKQFERENILFDKFTNIVKFEKYKNFTRLERA